MLSKNEIAREIESRTGIKPTLSKTVLDTLGNIVQEHVKAGNDISVPGLVNIRYGYTKPRRKGEEYAGFGGEMKTAEKATPEKIRLSINIPGGKKKLLPTKGTKAYKAVVARKGA